MDAPMFSPGRATSWDDFADRMEAIFRSKEEAYDAFEPRPSDVIISPFAKCGTTWLQQIVHSLRTVGDMDFSDIYDVIPFIDVALDLGIDLAADQRAHPRVFKSHHAWDEIPKGCRYIVSFRDPQDAVVSYYHFVSGWVLERGAMALDEFVDHRALDRENGSDYWHHMSSWLRQRENPDVLLLTFEHAKDDLRGVIERIAGFIGADSDGAVDAAVRNASFDFMAANREVFSEPLLRAHAARVARVPVDGDASKVRSGTAGRNRQELSAATRDKLDAIWHETIAAEFGYPTYRDLDRAIRELP